MRKKLLPLLLAFALFSLGVIAARTPVFAQSPVSGDGEAQAKKYGVTFPIAELGNCSSFQACRSYCDSEANREVCVSFAKKKGFYKEVENDRREAMLKSAKDELGCSAKEACEALCHDQANFEKCQAFAKKHGFGDGPNPRQALLLKKAKEVLGCDSKESCEAVCQKEANREKCSQFAQSNGMRGGIERKGPGGCTSEESCKAFCSDEKNREICQRFSGGPQGSNGRQGFGGCNNEADCKVFCQDPKNGEVCGQFGTQGGPNGQFNQRGQQGPGGCTSEESCRKLCQEKPELCGRGGNGPQGGSGSGMQNRPFERPPTNNGQFERRDFSRPVDQPGTQSEPNSLQGSDEFEDAGDDDVRGASTSRNALIKIAERFLSLLY